MDAVRSKDVQIMCCGDGETVPIIFGGAIRAAIKISALCFVGADIVIEGVLCEGEVQSIKNILFDDDTPPAGTKINVYVGDDNAIIDPILKAAFASQKPPIEYADRHPGIAKIVIRANASGWSSMPNITAEVEGFKMWDDRKPEQLANDPATWKFSRNPALCTAELFRRYTDLTVDSTCLIEAMNANDEQVGNAPRREMSLILDRPQNLTQWIDAFRSYANAWCVPQGGVVRIVPDRPAESVYTFTDAPGESNIVDGTFKWWLTDAMNQPTVVCVETTDTTTNPYGKQYPTATSSGVLTGALDRRRKVLSMEGITTYAQGYREAVEQLNHSLLEPFNASWDAFDDALELNVGDVVTVSFGVICQKMKMRLLAVVNKEVGRYSLTARQYAAAVYSDSVASAPATIAPLLPDPSAPPAISGLTMAEVLYQKQSRKYGTRFEASWSRPEWPYAFDYVCELTCEGRVIDVATVHTEAYASPDVQEGKPYVLRVAVKTAILAGPYAVASAVGLGKQLPPGDVPAFTQTLEAGGKVFLTWQEAPDITVDDKSDVERYEIRRAPDVPGLDIRNVPPDIADALWNDAVLVDQIDALTARIDGEPTGTWLYMIKAIDSVRNYSLHPLIARITVTLDVNAFLLDHYIYGYYTPTNMSLWRRLPDRRRQWSTNMADPAGYGIADTFAEHAGNVVATYHSPGASSLLTEVWDVGYVIGGYWQIEAEVTAHEGRAETVLELSDDLATWARNEGGSAHATGRFARVRFETDGTMTVADAVKIVVNAVPREESHIIDVPAGGFATLTLDNRYAKATSIIPTVIGTLPRTVIIDNIVVGSGIDNSVDVYVFDNNNQRVPARVQVVFKGI